MPRRELSRPDQIESWLQDAGPREQLFAVALDLMLARKETIKKVTGRDVYKEMIDKYQDTVCRIAGGQENMSASPHVLPKSRGGTDRWENVVAACKRCNWNKDNRTPEEAGMPLLAIPFRPNSWEWHFLAKERILADQMDYLSHQFRAQRAWAN